MPLYLDGRHVVEVRVESARARLQLDASDFVGRRETWRTYGATRKMMTHKQGREKREEQSQESETSYIITPRDPAEGKW